MSSGAASSSAPLDASDLVALGVMRRDEVLVLNCDARPRRPHDLQPKRPRSRVSAVALFGRYDTDGSGTIE